MHDHADFELVCFFCGEDAGHEHVMLGAFWDRAHSVSHEHWPAHGRCLLEHMSALTRSRGGPFLQAMTAGESALGGGEEHR